MLVSSWPKASFFFFSKQKAGLNTLYPAHYYYYYGTSIEMSVPWQIWVKSPLYKLCLDEREYRTVNIEWALFFFILLWDIKYVLYVILSFPDVLWLQSSPEICWLSVGWRWWCPEKLRGWWSLCQRRLMRLIHRQRRKMEQRNQL